MTRLQAWPAPCRRLIFGGVPLLPVENLRSLWHVPGGRVMDTQDIMTLGRKRGIHVFLFERGNRSE